MKYFLLKISLENFKTNQIDLFTKSSLKYQIYSINTDKRQLMSCLLFETLWPQIGFIYNQYNLLVKSKDTEK